MSRAEHARRTGDEVVREAMVVAGGKGTRLRPLTLTTPKPLLAFCGEPLLAGLIRRLAAAGVDHVLLVVGSDVAPFEVLRPLAHDLDVRLTLVPEPEPLDTAGGVRSVLDHVSGTFLVVNGDILTDVDLAAAVAAHHSAAADATLVLTRVEDTSTFGVCVRDGSRIVEFVEKPPPGSLPGQDAVNAGTYVLEPDLLASQPTGRLSFERDVFPAALAAGRHLEGFVWDGAWADLGTPERFLAGHRLVLSRTLRWPSLERLTEREPGIHVEPGADIPLGARLRPPVAVMAGSYVEDGAVVGPHAVLGAGSRVAAGARVHDSVLFDHVAVASRAVVADSIVGSRVAVPAGARVRGGVIGDDEHVATDTVASDGR